MKKSIILFFVFFSLCINSSRAQKQNFEEGTLYLTDGKTVDGFIELNTLEKTGQRVLFQESASSSVQTYLPNQLEGFMYKNTKTHFRSITFNYYKDDGVTSNVIAKTNNLKKEKYVKNGKGLYF